MNIILQNMLTGKYFILQSIVSFVIKLTKFFAIFPLRYGRNKNMKIIIFFQWTSNTWNPDAENAIYFICFYFVESLGLSVEGVHPDIYMRPLSKEYIVL